MKELFALSIAILSLINFPAQAGDLTPPAWVRDEPGTSFSQWEFSTSTPTPAPDSFFNLSGTPTSFIISGSGGWHDTFDGHQGVWPLSGKATIHTPTGLLTGAGLDLWVQVTWEPDLAGFGDMYPFVLDVDSGILATLVSQTPLDGQWMHSTYEMHLSPGLPLETLQVSGNIELDELLIDTRMVVPEPSVIALAMLGALAFLMRHRTGTFVARFRCFPRLIRNDTSTRTPRAR
jgi:hypothetical protein